MGLIAGLLCDYYLIGHDRGKGTGGMQTAPLPSAYLGYLQMPQFTSQVSPHSISHTSPSVPTVSWALCWKLKTR